MRQRLLPPIIMLSVVLTGGSVGYVMIEGWSVWDAFYMTTTTVATVGYREVHPLSQAGQAFTVLLVFIGVGTALYTFTAFATVAVEGGWPKYVERWRGTRMINSLSDHYVVCGFGRIGSIVANEFKRQKTPYVIVDRSADRVAAATAQGHLAIEGDASREDTLRRLGIERARGLVAAVGTDAENVYAVLTARVMKSDLFIIARAERRRFAAKIEDRGRRSCHLTVPNRCDPDRADGAPSSGSGFRRDRHQLGQSGAVNRRDSNRTWFAACRTTTGRGDRAR
jgi:voltage-gated potassium channel